MNTLTMWVLVSLANSSPYAVNYSPTIPTMADCEVFRSQVAQMIQDKRGVNFNGKCMPIKVVTKK